MPLPCIRPWRQGSVFLASSSLVKRPHLSAVSPQETFFAHRPHDCRNDAHSAHAHALLVGWVRFPKAGTITLRAANPHKRGLAWRLNRAIGKGRCMRLTGTTDGSLPHSSIARSAAMYSVSSSVRWSGMASPHAPIPSQHPSTRFGPITRPTLTAVG